MPSDVPGSQENERPPRKDGLGLVLGTGSDLVGHLQLVHVFRYSGLIVYVQVGVIPAYCHC